MKNLEILIFKSTWICLLFLINTTNIYGQINYLDSENIDVVNIETTKLNTELNYSLLLKKDIGSSHQILSENLDKIPGLQSYNMGPGNAKTAIRGLSGNRIGIYIDGLRLDNQQWQDEHGLSFIAFDNDEQRVFLGPSSTILGNEAMGGLLSINQSIPESFGVKQNLLIGISSNDLGFTVKYEREFKNSQKNKWINFYYSTHGDYLDGKGNNILNSRFDILQFKTGSQREFKNKKKLLFNYRFSASQTGIARITDSLELIEIKNGDSREFEGPNHFVAMQSLVTKLSQDYSNGKSEILAGLITNTRIELEDYKMDGLGMQLNTIQIKHNREWNVNNWKFHFSENAMYQMNINFGNNIVVPNKALFISGITGIIKKRIRTFNLNAQLSIHEQIIFNKKETNIFFTMPNLSISGFQKINQQNEIGVRISKNFRAPNLHELFAFGLSEDAFRFDIGNPNFKVESLSQFELNYINQNKNHSFQCALFIGKLYNFITLESANKYLNKAPVFEYSSNTGNMTGGEFTFSAYNLTKSFIFQTCMNYNHIQSNEKNIAFSPPLKIKSNLTLMINGKLNSLKNIKINIEHIYTRVIQAYFEIDKIQNSFSIWNLYISKKLTNSELSIQIKNTFSNQYIDPMSMLKTIPYHAIGLNVCIFYKHHFN